MYVCSGSGNVAGVSLLDSSEELIGGSLSRLMLLCGFPKETLIHCWFGLLLCCVSASEQCVKTAYLPRSVGERTGPAPDGLDEHHVTSQPIFSPSVSLSSFLICSVFIHGPFFVFVFFGFHPPAPALLCPLFLCLPLLQHNVYLWKRGWNMFHLAALPTLPTHPCLLSFVSYKRAVDTLVWSLFHAESN